MTGIAAARPSIGISGDGNGATGARARGVPGCVGAPILGCAGLPSANRSIARALKGLIVAPDGGMFIGREPNGESWFRCDRPSPVMLNKQHRGYLIWPSLLNDE